jgi:cobalamin synthase
LLEVVTPLRVVIAACALVLIAGGVSTATLTLVRMKLAWPRPMKTGVWFDPQDYIWLGWVLIAIGLVVLGVEASSHALRSAGVWCLIASLLLQVLLRTRDRRKRFGGNWWRTWKY